MAPMNVLSVRRTMAKLTSSPLSYFAWWVLIHCSDMPSSYGCGTLSVVEAISRSPARRWTSGASALVNGLRIRRVVSRVGRSFMALYFQEHLTWALGEVIGSIVTTARTNVHFRDRPNL